MIENPANEVCCFFSCLRCLLILSKILGKNELELVAMNEIPNGADQTCVTHLMCATGWSEQPWAPNHKNLPSFLTTTIVIAAECNNDHSVLILGSIDHTLKRITHRFAIFFV
jgi:hypothetical protein